MCSTSRPRQQQQAWTDFVILSSPPLARRPDSWTRVVVLRGSSLHQHPKGQIESTACVLPLITDARKAESALRAHEKGGSAGSRRGQVGRHDVRHERLLSGHAWYAVYLLDTVSGVYKSRVRKPLAPRHHLCRLCFGPRAVLVLASAAFVLHGGPKGKG